MKTISKILILMFVFFLGYVARGLRLYKQVSLDFVSPISNIREKPFEKYAIKYLGAYTPTYSTITLQEPTATESAYTVHPFHFYSGEKKVTGLAHVPTLSPGKKAPVIIQLRGYVDREIYTSGIGTQRSAAVYASNGYVSLAPDFLGYGGSDMPSEQIFEERFQTYTTTLNLIASLGSLAFVDSSRMGIWGHSNGGQIALTILEGSKRKDIPTTLWAPVTKPFPYSILYFTDELSDEGKFLRQELAKFENEYDVFDYALTHHVADIQSPLMIHQGTADDAVPQDWNDEFVRLLQDANVNASYYVYPGADHNMMGSWDTVVSRDIEFFNTYLK